MKYLDENIEVSVSGITVPLAGTYVYKVYDGLNNVIFLGNTYLNAGDTQKTFDITDILANLKWKAALKKPLTNHNGERVNNINRYCLTLNVNNTLYSSETIDVAFVYRYPNRKIALEASLFDCDTISGVGFQNCLQGAKNWVCELLPHIPYKITSEYGFGVVAEAVSGSNYYATINTNLTLDGDLYLDNPIGVVFSGISGHVFNTLGSIFSGAKESVVSKDVTLNGYTRETEVEYPLYYCYNDPEHVPTSVTVYTDAGIKKHYALGMTHNIDIEMEAADGGHIYISHSNADASTYIRLGGTEFSAGTVHVTFRGWERGDDMVFMLSDLQISKGNQGSENTYVNLNLPNQLVGASIIAEDYRYETDETTAINFLAGLGMSYEEATTAAQRIEMGKWTTIWSGPSNEADAIYSQANAIFECSRDDYYGNEPQHIAEVDKGCMSKYYLMWQDRYGGYQSQAFEKTETFGIDYTYDEMKDYQNARRNITVKAQPKWKIQTGWLEEKYYPYYESIFSSPYVLLYDTEEDKSYNVIATDKKYTEKTWKNQHKFFNLELNLELNKVQNILY